MQPREAEVTKTRAVACGKRGTVHSRKSIQAFLRMCSMRRGLIKDFTDEAAKAYIRGDDDAYIGALNSADALLTGLLNDDDEEDEE